VQEGDIVSCDANAANAADKVEGFTFTIMSLGRPPRIGGCTIGSVGTPCWGIAGVYKAHYLCLSSFILDPTPGGARTRGGAVPKQLDRQGLHTFRFGDIVYETSPAPGTDAVAAAVGAIIIQPPQQNLDTGKATQSRRILLLKELPVSNASIPFFAGSWKKWERRRMAGAPEVDIDDADAEVEALGKDDMEQLQGYLNVALSPHASAVGKLIYNKTPSAAEHQMKNMPPEKNRLLVAAEYEKKRAANAVKKLATEAAAAAAKKKKDKDKQSRAVGAGTVAVVGAVAARHAEQHDEGCRWSEYCGAEGEGDEKSEYGEEDKRATDQARAEKEKQARDREEKARRTALEQEALALASRRAAAAGHGGIGGGGNGDGADRQREQWERFQEWQQQQEQRQQLWEEQQQPWQQQRQAWGGSGPQPPPPPPQQQWQQPPWQQLQPWPPPPPHSFGARQPPPHSMSPIVLAPTGHRPDTPPREVEMERKLAGLGAARNMPAGEASQMAMEEGALHYDLERAKRKRNAPGW